MCGDVDVLITMENDKEKDKLNKVASPFRKDSTCLILTNILKYLEKSKFLVERLGNDRVSKSGSYTYMGICMLPGEGQMHRRIDIKVYPQM